MLGLCRKFVIMVLFIFVTCGLFLAGSCVAPVTMPANPSPAPEVSVVVYDTPEWVPPTYYTNPYTGEVTMTSPGYWASSGIIEVTIKNSSFEPYYDGNGNYINEYYTFWAQANLINIPWDELGRPSYVLYRSDSAYTVVSFRYGGKITYDPEHFWATNRVGHTLYFRVQSVIGYFHGQHPYRDAIFEGEGSKWASFTVTIPGPDNPGISTPIFPSNPSVTSTFNPNNSQSTPQHDPSLFDMVVVRVFVALCIIVVLMAATAFLFKQRKTKSPPNQN